MQDVTLLKAVVLLCCTGLPGLYQTLQHRAEEQPTLSAAFHKENGQAFLVSDSEWKLTGTALYRIGRCSPANLPRHVIWGIKIEPLALYLVLAMLGDSAPSLHLSS